MPISSSEAILAESAALVAFVATSDLDKAEQFYGSTLGLSLRDERPHALIAQVGGTMLRVTAVQSVVVAPYTVLGWSVVDIDAAVDDLTSRGVSFMRYDGVSQDDRRVWTAPGGSRIAWFLDPEGHNLSLTQFVESE